MENEKYTIDDNINIPFEIQNMTKEQLEEAINILENELFNKN